MDRLGTLVSVLCAVHCALVPLVMATMSSFTLTLLSWRDPNHGWVMWLLRISAWEAWVVSGALVFAAISIGLHVRWHRSVRPVLFFVAAAVAFSMALYSPMVTSPITHAMFAVIGGYLLAGAHIANLRATRRAPLRK